MSKLSLNHRIPFQYDRQTITDIITAIQEQLNSLSEGRIYARHLASSVAPTTGDWAQGDIMWNAGVSSTGFVGWVCIAGGNPGTWTTFGAVS